MIKNKFLDVSKSKFPFVVYWTKWDRTTPQWRPINKWQRCSTLNKAGRLKKLLLSQTSFIEVRIAQEI